MKRSIPKQFLLGLLVLVLAGLIVVVNRVRAEDGENGSENESGSERGETTQFLQNTPAVTTPSTTPAAAAPSSSSSTVTTDTPASSTTGGTTPSVRDDNNNGVVDGFESLFTTP